MKFSELLSKITVARQNQVPNESAYNKGVELAKITSKCQSIIHEKESKVQCSVNGKARKIKEEKKESELEK